MPPSVVIHSAVQPERKSVTAWLYWPVGHVLQLDPGEIAEHGGGEMAAGAGAERGIVELARIGLGVVDEIPRTVRKGKSGGTISTSCAVATSMIGSRNP